MLSGLKSVMRRTRLDSGCTPHEVGFSVVPHTQTALGNGQTNKQRAGS